MSKYDEEMNELSDLFWEWYELKTEYSSDESKEFKKKIEKVIDKLIQDKCDNCECVCVDECSEPTINESND